MRGIVLLLMAALCGLATAEVLMEVGFNLAEKEKTNEGYTADNALSGYLQTTNLKWLRYFHVLHSAERASQRVAFLGFRDAEHWAKFEEEQLVKTHTLFDHFWMKSTSVLWHETTPAKGEDPYPSNDRSIETPGGFMFQLKYTLEPGKVAEWKNVRSKAEKNIIHDLKAIPGFVERHEFESRNFHVGAQNLLMWEFLDVPSLAKAVYESQHITQMLEDLPKYCSTWSMTFLAPPVTGEGKQQGYFFPAAGADKDEETEEKK